MRLKLIPSLKESLTRNKERIHLKSRLQRSRFFKKYKILRRQVGYPNVVFNCAFKNGSEKVQQGNVQEKAQSEKDSHSEKPRWEKLN